METDSNGENTYNIKTTNSTVISLQGLPFNNKPLYIITERFCIYIVCKKKTTHAYVIPHNQKKY